MEKELVVGEVLKPQGIRGEIKVKPFTDSPEDFRKFARVFLGGTEYKILSMRHDGSAVYLGLRGVPDRNAAELLRGKEIVIPRDEAPQLPDGRYYIADLLGLEIITEKGTSLGTLTNIRTAATDVYTLTQGEKEILFPAVDDLILNVDIANRKITVSEKRFYEVAVL